MTDTQYRILSELWHEYNEAFLALPQSIQSAYYARLYAK